MSEARPFASLSSGLLARKGGAKPAMRPQNFGQEAINFEDLGWNDMGHEPAPAAVPVQIAPQPAPQPAAPPVADAPVPEVVEQQRAIAGRFGQESPAPAKPRRKPRAAQVVALPRAPRAAESARDKAAFTLRLDKDRHLKLRLACAVGNRSAQQIVTDALDQFLNSLPELDALARRVPASLGKRS